MTREPGRRGPAPAGATRAASWPGDRLELPPADRLARRRLGFGLTLFGAIGLLVFGTGLWVVVAPVDEDSGPFGLERQRRQLVAMIDASAEAIAEAETAAANVDGSLGSTAAAAGSASRFMAELATTMRSLAGALRSSLLGQALGGPAAEFEGVADRATSVAADLQQAAESVELAATDIAALSRDLGEMRTELDGIRDSIGEPIQTGAWRLVIGAMLLWLAIPAAVSLALGLRWLGVRRFRR